MKCNGEFRVRDWWVLFVACVVWTLSNVISTAPAINDSVDVVLGGLREGCLGVIRSKAV